jgi:hypothetical protein
MVVVHPLGAINACVLVKSRIGPEKCNSLYVCTKRIKWTHNIPCLCVFHLWKHLSIMDSNCTWKCYYLIRCCVMFVAETSAWNKFEISRILTVTISEIKSAIELIKTAQFGTPRIWICLKVVQRARTQFSWWRYAIGFTLRPSYPRKKELSVSTGWRPDGPRIRW